MNVRPRLQGDFAVLIGTLPSLTWFTADPPPRLGELVTARGQVERVVDEHTTVLRAAQFEIVPEPFARRFVPEKWRQRATAVVVGNLHDYQVEGAAWLASRLAEGRGGILADEPGLGKTRQTIAAILAADVLPCLLICPAILRHHHVWTREIEKVVRWPLRVFEVSGKKPLEPAHFVVASYEVVARREEEFSKHRFQSLVCDEAHAVKNALARGNHRAAIVDRMSERIRRVALLTGSPIPNQVEEIWRLLRIVDRDGPWGTLEQFRKRYCTAQDGDRRIVQSATGTLARVEEFHALIGPCFLRRQKEHVLDLPPKIRRVVRVELHTRDWQAYQAAHKDVQAWLKSLGEEGIRSAGSKTLLRLTYLRRIAAIGKLRKVFPAYVSAWIAKVKRPLVVFGYHQSVMAGAARVAAAVGARVGVLSARVPEKTRSRIIDAFDEGAYDVLCCPLRLAGVGLNLQSASDCLFLERFWTPAMMDQAESRCHRIGVKRQVVCTYFDAVGTIDEYIAYIARSKLKIIDHAVGDAHALQVASRLAAALPPTS